jgi:DNA gyrase subunit A
VHWQQPEALQHDDAGHRVVGATVVSEARFKAATKEAGPWILLATSDGLGKRVALSEFPLTARGAAGVIGIKLSDRASLVDVHIVEEDSSDGEGVAAPSEDSSDGEGVAAPGEAVKECLLASSSGMMSRIPLTDINVYGRSAQGVRITRLNGSDTLSSITPCKYRHLGI